MVLLNPCFIFSKNLILTLIDKVTTGSWKFSPSNNKTCSCYVNMLYGHNIMYHV